MTLRKKHKTGYTPTPFGVMLPKATRPHTFRDIVLTLSERAKRNSTKGVGARRAHRVERCRGYTLLIAAIIGSFLLAVSFSIVTLTAKEVRLAASTRDSQLAFYAADTGVECAIYWDIKFSGGTSAFATSSASNQPSSGIICSQNDIAQGWVITDKTSSSATTIFMLDLGVIGDNKDLCTEVLVEKTNNGNNTKIESRGRSSCDTSNIRRVERAIRVTY